MDNISQKALIELIKIGIGTGKGDFDFGSLSPEDWKGVMLESRAQAVSLMALDSAKEYVNLIPQDVYERWLKCSVNDIVNNSLLFKAQKELDTVLQKNNIRYMILKGSASAYYYPNSKRRVSGDIDFMAQPQKFPQITEILTDLGYTVTNEKHDVHIIFRKNGVSLEMHRRPSGVPEGKPGELAKDFMKDALETSVNRDGNFIMPNDKIHALIILLHTVHHLFFKGMGIRHLCDWACFVNKTHKEPFWQEELLPLFEKMGLYRFVTALTSACIDYLCIDTPSWLVRDNKTLSDDIFDMVINLGNFGRKNPKRQKDYSIESVNGERLNMRQRIIVMFKALNRTNKKMYPILNKAPYLYPFIMVWRVLKYLVLSLAGKKTSLKERMNFADERAQLFEKFEIYRGVGNE